MVFSLPKEYLDVRNAQKNIMKHIDVFSNHSFFDPPDREDTLIFLFRGHDFVGAMELKKERKINK